MTLTLRLVLALMILPSTLLAAPPGRHCPPTCKHRRESAHLCPAPAPSAPCPSLLEQLRDGFELTAGFRWDIEHECPTPTRPVPGTRPHDPGFIGASERVSFSPTSHVGVFGNLDRDWTDAPEWSARVGLYWKP